MRHPKLDFHGMGYLVSCPSRARASQRETVWWTKSNFLGLFPKSVEDQWDCDIT